MREIAFIRRQRWPSSGRRATLRRCLVVSALMVGLSAPMLPVSAGIAPPYANETLRTYFKTRLTESYGWAEGHTQPFISHGDLEWRIDLLIEDFTKQLTRDLARIADRLEEVDQSREQILNAPRQLQPPLLQQWRADIDELENRVDDLHGLLSSVIADLDSSCKFDPKVEAADRRLLFSRQVDFIESELRQATSQVLQFFFRPSHTVSLDELKGSNMLVKLHRSEKMAKALKNAVSEILEERSGK